MIYFITNKKHNIINDSDNELIVTLPFNDLHILSQYLECKIIDNDFEIGYDLETTGLQPYQSQILLIILGDKETKFVIDYNGLITSENSLNDFTIESIMTYICDKFTFVGHNVKFDWQFTKTKLKIELVKCYCTMIVEQRLYANYFPTGYDLITKEKLRPFALDSLVRRYFGVIPKEMNKAIRMEFVGVNPETFVFQTKHILYAAKDIEYLFDIKVKQEVQIKNYRMEFLFNEIEFPLINCLGESELEGFILKKDKWKSIIAENEVTKFTKECELDEIIRNCRESLPKEDKIWLVGGKFDVKRIKQQKQINIGLFGEEVSMKALTGTKKEPKDNPNNFNYGSSDQIIDLFARLKQPLPTNSDTYEIPKLINGKIEKSKFTTGEASVQGYLIDNPNSPMKDFIETLIDFREATTELNTFGQSFIDYINPITHKIHTTYRQCDAVNGRLQSGNTDAGFINIQNIPAKKKFRQSFGTDIGYSIVTCDLSGAEVTVMADKANDKKLFDLCMKGDVHSHFAQAGWRKIYWKRYNDAVETFDSDEEVSKLEKLARYFIVNKTTNNESHRKPCKNLSFGSIYGCHAKKAGRTLNISKEEGQIYINTIKSEIPLTFKMVEKNVELAIKQGYLVLNTRTNSRVWFPKAINSIKTKFAMDFMDRTEIDGQARNIPISGTQADAVKEAMVVIRKEIKRQGLDAVLLAQVHDEIVVKFHDSITKVEFKEDDEENYRFISFGKFISLTMNKVANRYLNNLKMTSEYSIHKTWTK